jgi:hypothetical protein
MNYFSKLYVKYIIKSKVIFCAFLCLSILGFLLMTISLKLDIVTKYEAYFDNNKIVINQSLYNIDTLYIYKSLNEKVYFFDVINTEYIEQYTILYVNNIDERVKNSLLGVVKIEIVTGKQSLFELIYLRAGKKRNE